MGCINVANFIAIHDKPHTFPTVVDKMTVHTLVLYGEAKYVRYFEFTTGGLVG